MARNQEKYLHDSTTILRDWPDHRLRWMEPTRTLSRKISMKLTIINDDPGQGPKIEIEEDGLDMFVIVDGVTIARRGRPGTTEADTWVSLEPEWTVTSSEDERRLDIRILYHGEPMVLH
jgi:hypothetical protein